MNSTAHCYQCRKSLDYILLPLCEPVELSQESFLSHYSGSCLLQTSCRPKKNQSGKSHFYQDYYSGNKDWWPLSQRLATPVFYELRILRQHKNETGSWYLERSVLKNQRSCFNIRNGKGKQRLHSTLMKQPCSPLLNSLSSTLEYERKLHTLKLCSIGCQISRNIKLTAEFFLLKNKAWGTMFIPSLILMQVIHYDNMLLSPMFCHLPFLALCVQQSLGK